MSLIQTEKLIRALDKFQPQARALRDSAQRYIDDRANGKHGRWSFDAEGHGTLKSGADRREAAEFDRTISKAISAMPALEALAADIATMTAEMDALQVRIDAARVLYTPRPEPRGLGLDDLG
jgi:hypothetical protein